MKLTKILLSAVVLTTLAFASCKPKDADIKASIDTAIAANPALTGAVVEVKDGVATVVGEVKDDATKALYTTVVTGVKGVKSVVNNSTITAPPPPPPASVTVSALTDAVQQKIKDGLKDIKGLTSVSFSEKGAVLIGEVDKAANLKIKQILGTANVTMDAAASKLTIK